LSDGYYAPVYDPAQNAFSVTASPLSSGPGFGVVKIDAATGGSTQLLVHDNFGFAVSVNGLGVDTLTNQLDALAVSGGDVVFGTVSTTNGQFTQIGGVVPSLFTGGTWAPVFDPALNAFFIPRSPIGGNTSNLDKIDATTGAVTGLNLTAGGSPVIAVGLGFDTKTAQLFGLVSQAGTTFFGTIDPATGQFTQIGGNTGLSGSPGAAYAPVYDPQTDSFLVTHLPLNSGNTFEDKLLQIDASTGATQLKDFPGPNPPFSGAFMMGIGVANNPTAAVPEPSTWAMMLIGFAGLGFASYRASRRRAQVEA
jgi:hypothetical protein